MSGKAKESVRDRLLARGARRREAVELPGFEGELYLRSMTAGERIQVEALMVREGLGAEDGDDPQEAVARVEKYLRSRLLMVGLTLVDGEGAHVFADDPLEGVSALDSEDVLPLVDVAERLNAIGPDAVEAAKKD